MNDFPPDAPNTVAIPLSAAPSFPGQSALQPHQQRVIEERDQLAERLGKLNLFIMNNPAYKRLDDYDQMTLVSQASVMGMYLMLLEERIRRFK